MDRRSFLRGTVVALGSTGLVQVQANPYAPIPYALKDDIILAPPPLVEAQLDLDDMYIYNAKGEPIGWIESLDVTSRPIDISTWADQNKVFIAGSPEGTLTARLLPDYMTHLTRSSRATITHHRNPSR